MTPKEHAEVAWSLYRTGGDPSPDELGAHQNFVAGYIRALDLMVSVALQRDEARDRLRRWYKPDGSFVLLDSEEVVRSKREAAAKLLHKIAYLPFGHAEATAQEILDAITAETRALLEGV